MRRYIILSFAFSGLFSCNHSEQINQEKKGKKNAAEAILKQTASKKDTLIQDGENLEFYPGGKLKFQGVMKNGKRDGVWRSFYENGAKWSETTFLEGRKNGKTTTWYDNSTIRYEGNFANDMESGKWIYFDEKGKKIKEIDFDRK